MRRPQSLKEQIIEYWDKAGLCSFDSPTSNADPYLVSCDNFVESRFLEELLETSGISKQDASGIDIGAGLGRFTIILAKHLKLVHALEPASSLYPKLVANCADFSNIKAINTDFESFDTQNDYNIAVVSGVLYLYSDDMVHELLKKVANHLKPGGLVVIRDFIVEDELKQIPSSYINGGFCYYRLSHYWRDLAQEFSLELSEIFQSKPSYPMPKLLGLTSRLGLARVFSASIAKKLMYQNTKSKREKGILDFHSSPILTVFMVMRRKQ